MFLCGFGGEESCMNNLQVDWPYLAYNQVSLIAHMTLTLIKRAKYTRGQPQSRLEW